MSDLDFNAFSKKYSFAINGLEMRLKSSGKNAAAAALAKKLYEDAAAKKINMDEVTNNLQMFYQGNVFGQLKLNQYLEKYKNL